MRRSGAIWNCVIVVGLLGGAWGCSPDLWDPPPDSSEADKTLAVREALVREAIRSHEQVELWFLDDSGGGNPPRTFTDGLPADGFYTMHIGGADPSDAFLERFSDLPVTIKKISDAIVPAPLDFEDVRDRETGRAGWVVRARVALWLDERTAQAEYAVTSGRTASGEVWKVRYCSGKWELGRIPDSMWWAD